MIHVFTRKGKFFYRAEKKEKVRLSLPLIINLILHRICMREGLAVIKLSAVKTSGNVFKIF